MFLSKYKNIIIDKANALPGRDNPLDKILYHELNERDITFVPQGYKNIILGMGCFWGAEKIFWGLNGVYHTSVGYAGGHTRNPTYEEVCSGLTGHTEVVRVVYDPQQIKLLDILISFLEGHNPTEGMRQGNDIGTQYRSALFFNDNEDLKEIKETMKIFQSKLNVEGIGDITTEIKSNVDFYFAETYHQQYLYKNPNGYCGLNGCGVKFK
ncbi:peptide-methionine (S)-S-oxide reductase MsrA [Alphaproteobacteria bacterium]|nr:peptide-methionine (S)-S-oxide reductase MsrA [Alphaproteobacteria bacterium]